MWYELKKTPNLIIAEAWKELLDIESVCAEIALDEAEPEIGEGSSRRVMVPTGKDHVAREVLRKI